MWCHHTTRRTGPRESSSQLSDALLQGELLDAGDTGNGNHHNRHIVSDMTLALLQDTNWCAPRPPLHSCLFSTTLRL